jgi:hypothetical protein
MFVCRESPDGTACGTGQVCRAGSCVAPCPIGQTSCGGVCVNLNTNPNHCGACRRVCASGVCNLGTCAGTCMEGQTLCPPLNRCVNLNNNRLHCGACNTPCPPLQMCRMGICRPRLGGDPGDPEPVEP